MSDDEDYMSDKFLLGIEKCSSSSLIHKHADRRKFELMKKKTEVDANLREKSSVKYIEQQKREEGLSSAITSTNKGFELLMKMGYKPGHGIGKTESGITEPIGVEVKLNRHGIGKGVKRKEIDSKSSSTSDKLNNKNMKDFRGRIAQKKAEQLLRADLRKSQKVCEELDLQLKIEKPMEAWFWLPQETEDDSDTEETEEIEEESPPETEQLEILTKYLRDKHFYCIWCGIAYHSEDDLGNNCPGNTRDDH